MIRTLVFTVSLLIHMTVCADSSPSQSKTSVIPPEATVTTSQSTPNNTSYLISVKNPSQNVATQPIVININQTPKSEPVAIKPPDDPNKPVSPPARPPHKSAPHLISIPPIPALNIVIHKRYRNSPEIKKLYRMLGIKTKPKTIHLINDRSLAEKNHQNNIFYIQTRSYRDALDYLGFGVEIPPIVIQKNLVSVPRYPNGDYFDLNQLTTGVLRVHVSDKRPPSNASVSVFYRNHWYYVSDCDQNSKRTFTLMEEVFNLQAGEVPNTSPVLTIPVGRR
jgi:hypothetical protein